MHLAIGSYLQDGKYKIEKVLGQGTFGITYKCYHTKLQKYVAIKEFFMRELNGRSADSQVTGLTDASLSYNYGQKFKKEAINLSRLDHPNIVRVIDSFDENGTFYYVMDFLEGENLNEYIKSHNITQDEAVSIILEVSKALIYMHEERHMLHLDLKPGNIMRRNSDGHIFLIDFGLSKLYSDDGQPETSTTIGLGTAGYAPIEQGNNRKSGEFRPTIDVYALGATLFRLLTNETPPAASDLVSDEDVIMNLMMTKGISSSLIDVVVKAMSPSVKKRIQSVQSFSNMLEECLTDYGNIEIRTGNDSANSNQNEYPNASETFEETKIIDSKQEDNAYVNSNSHGSVGVAPSLDMPNTASDAKAPKKKKMYYILSAILVCLLTCVIVIVSTHNNDKSQEDGLHAVDLGLSVNWASQNIGASGPEDAGQYFAFGETSPKTRFTWDNYKYPDPGMMDSVAPFQVNLPANICGTNMDAATVNLGDKWRLPTKKECEELINKCKWEACHFNGKYVMKVTGPNGKYIFLPFVDLLESNEYLVAADWSYGHYPTGEISRDRQGPVELVFHDNGEIYIDSWYPAYYGRVIRAVCPK